MEKFASWLYDIILKLNASQNSKGLQFISLSKWTRLKRCVIMCNYLLYYLYLEYNGTEYIMIELL